MHLNIEAERYFSGKREEAAQLLSKLITFPSVYGNETGMQEYLHSYCNEKGIGIGKDRIPDSIKTNPHYSFAKNDISFDNRYNLTGIIKGAGGGKSVILNAHSDVLTAPSHWQDAFKGGIKDGIVGGRGACDDKGGIVSILLALEAVKDMGIRLHGDVIYQFVIDEETGGNGTLSLIEKGCRAECALVLEPTELKMCVAGRGCIHFQITVPGVSVHMAEIEHGISAVDNAIEVIGALKAYEKKLMADSGDHFLFRWHRRPIQMNVGMIHGGENPSMVPDRVVIEGGIGFLPSKRMKDVMDEMRNFVIQNANCRMRDKITVEYRKLRNEAYEEDVNSGCVGSMQRALTANGLNSEPFGFIASCDARLFHHIAGIPCIVFGPGSIKNAHSTVEHCDTGEVVKAANVVFNFIADWCGKTGN